MNTSTVLKNVHFYKDKLIQMQRFSWWFKLLMLLPTILWFAEFNLSKYIPVSIRPIVNTTTLPYLDSRILFGHTLLHWPRNRLEDDSSYNGLVTFLDLLSAFVYIIHFCFAWIFSLGMYLYYRRKTDSNGKPLLTPWAFLWCLGLLNLFSVFIQLVWPTAPPWYVELYGTKPPSYSMGGSPAGLANADKILGLKLFNGLYGKSPIVFGSFPSLHGAWPIMITLFTPSTKFAKTLGVIYTSLVWWAAMYLNHHFLVDLLGGLLIVVLCYVCGMAGVKYVLIHFKERVYYNNGKSQSKSRFPDSPELELGMVANERTSMDDDESILRSPKMKRIPSSTDTALSMQPLLVDDNFNKPNNGDPFKSEKHL